MRKKGISTDKINAYLDEELMNIVFTDLTLEDRLLSYEGNIDGRSKEDYESINMCKLPNYLIGSVGYTSKELKERGIKFKSTKILSNDYNSMIPNYKIVYTKLLHDDKKVYGLQVANLNNIEKRLEAGFSVLNKENGLRELASFKVYEDTSEMRPDVVNILALTALGSLVKAREVDTKSVSQLQKDGAFFIDVREPEEFFEGHIRGAKNIPLRELILRKDEIPKDRDIYIYCRTAHRSADAVSILQSMGFNNAINVAGGFIDISFNEFKRDGGKIKNSILTNYNFD